MYHRRAMYYADRICATPQTQHPDGAKGWANLAYKYESRAALLLVDDYECEPSRSVIFRSAACLANEAKQYAQGAGMAALGLLGNPPEEIKAELQDALNTAIEGIKEDSAKWLNDEAIGCRLIRDEDSGRSIPGPATSLCATLLTP